ncbi:MAG TPA: leucyl aminopeptidase [Nocardioidaceae bacterium]|nr:leucyl aminopeptidase [Nocardioidaceae bacterium]
MTSISLRSTDPTRSRVDVIVIAVARSGKRLAALAPGDQVAAAFGRRFVPTLSTLGFEGKAGEIARLPSAGVVKSPLVIAVGVGDESSVTTESLRRAAGVGVRAIHNAASAAFALPTADGADVQAVCEGILLGGYEFTDYRSDDDEDDDISTVVVLTDLARTATAQQAVATATTVAEAVNRTRDWVNIPARDLTPASFADAVAALELPDRTKLTVWDDTRLEKEECGGILGVGQGSDNPPRLVRLAYKPKKPTMHLALVGKGITYDSGGLSLKTHAGLMAMKCDMAGAAAAMCATLAIASLELPIQVTCLAAMAENMVSGGSTRPGDVLTIRGGTTVEVHNTDAEGRLVLADALVVASEAKPDLIVDVATLTGPCIVALGKRTAGVMSNDDALRDAIPAAALRAGEPMWPLPIAEEMKAKVHSSTIADLRQHNPDPVGGALFAAAFLREFVGAHRWAHLDIAGPAFNDGDPFGYTPKGGTGSAVRTLIRLAQEFADES